ncbi:MAG: hypothetical protein ACWGQW_01075 [bacterium]
MNKDYVTYTSNGTTATTGWTATATTDGIYIQVNGGVSAISTAASVTATTSWPSIEIGMVFRTIQTKHLHNKLGSWRIEVCDPEDESAWSAAQ